MTLLIDRVMQFWDARPCNIRHSQADVDTDPLKYSQDVTWRKYFVEPHIPDFAQFKRWAGLRVLELGCGIGTDAISFAKAGADVVAVDISDRSLEIARKRAQAHPDLRGRIKFVRGNIEQLGWCIKPEHFDLVYSFGVLHHTPYPDIAIKYIRTYFMRPDSTLKIMLYNKYSFKAAWILATFGKFQFWKWSELIAQHSEAQSGCPITRPYTPKMARALLDGFIIEDMHVDHIFPYRIRDYVQYRYVKEWYWRWMPPRLFHWLERRIGWHLLITARLK